jgi:hypothetical protein
MGQGEVSDVEVGDTPREQPISARPPVTRRSAAAAVLAAVVAMALGSATFAVLSAHRTGPGASTQPPASTRTSAGTPTAPTVASSPTVGTSQMQAPMHGLGLPEGVEVITFTLTGTDEGRGTGGVITNPVTGMPDRGMVLHYVGGTGTEYGR